MGLFSKKIQPGLAEKDVSHWRSPNETSPQTQARNSLVAPGLAVHVAQPDATWKAIILGCIASIGGFIFGYESGQISGFLQMSDFLGRFGENGQFSAIRQGTIVSLLCAGTLLGCLISGDICDRIGRRFTISCSSFFYIVGVIIEITSSTSWAQFAMGRFTAGLGIGALSTSVPMYQSESVPASIRGMIVASYQLLITLGILFACIINYGTSKIESSSAQWRIPNGLSAAWALILGVAILLMPESPRYAYRQGRIDEARKTMASLVVGGQSHEAYIDQEIHEIQLKQEADHARGEHSWWEFVNIPDMRYRVLLGMVLQAGVQLTGVNFFFYYGTTIFKSTGIKDSFITSIILGAVNVVATILGLWIVKNVGRRKALMCGAAVMSGCFFVYSFLGNFKISTTDPESSPAAGGVLIAFTCIFIAAFATTWGPLVWAITGEIYPARYRATCLAIATASNWTFNFLISFFTTFITNKIGYLYGLVFGGSTFVLFFVVYFYLPETKDRTMEEVDTMFETKVPPRMSASWVKGDSGLGGTDALTTDHMRDTNKSRNIKKTQESRKLLVEDRHQFPEPEAAAGKTSRSRGGADNRV